MYITLDSHTIIKDLQLRRLTWAFGFTHLYFASIIGILEGVGKQVVNHLIY